jgi:hypothetical protein
MYFPSNQLLGITDVAEGELVSLVLTQDGLLRNQAHVQPVEQVHAFAVHTP